MLLILAIAMLLTSAFLVLEVATAPRRARRTLIQRAATYGRTRVAVEREVLPFRARVIVPFVARLAAGMLRLNPRQSIDVVSAGLLAAGMRRTSPHSFLAAKAVFGIGGSLLGALLGSTSSPLTGITLALAFGAGGFIAPSFLVSARARRSRAAILVALPDALDLLAVSVEAGMGFDAAISKLTEHSRGPLAEEFEFALGEIRIGESRQEALRRMAGRTSTQEVVAFVRAVIQADQLGTSLSRILRLQASETRLKRQAAAEERAMKAPIKMLFPTVLFIFPAMFIVVLGPALLSIGKSFAF